MLSAQERTNDRLLAAGFTRYPCDAGRCCQLTVARAIWPDLYTPISSRPTISPCAGRGKPQRKRVTTPLEAHRGIKAESFFVGFLLRRFCASLPSQKACAAAHRCGGGAPHTWRRCGNRPLP